MTTLEKIGLGFLLALAVFFYFESLGAKPFFDYDEATYADVAVKMANGTAPSSLTLYRLNQNGDLKPWFEKPPLLFWLMAGSMKVFGVNEFGARFPSALFGVLTVLIIAIVGRQLSGSWLTGIIAGAVLLSATLFLDAGRQGRLDTAVISFLLAAFSAFLKSLEQRPYLLLVGLFLGLGFLSKSVVIFLFFPVAILYLLFFRRTEFLALIRANKTWVGIGVFLLTILPWHLYEAAKFGRGFWNSYLIYHVLERAGQNILGEARPPLTFYFSYLWEFFQPWVFFFLGTVAFLFVIPRTLRSRLVFPVVITLLILLFFTLVPTKLGPYILPMVPFAALAIGSGATLAIIQWRQRLPAIIMVIVLFAFGFGMILAYHETHTSIPFITDEKAIGLLLRDSPKQPYLFNWPAIESLMFYSQKGIRAVSSLEAISDPFTSLLILPTSYARAFEPGPGVTVTSRYSGEVLSLLEFTGIP